MLDDGFESHLLDIAMLREELPVFAETYAAVERSHPQARNQLKFNETIKRILDQWLMKYCTDLDKPDAATVRAFPFRTAKIEVVPRPGEIGWYDCAVSILPHIQFEGMNVELRLESRLGAAGGVK